MGVVVKGVVVVLVMMEDGVGVVGVCMTFGAGVHHRVFSGV